MARKDITDKQVCQAYEQYNRRDRSSIRPLDYLLQVTGEPEKVCWRAMERALTHRLVEFGVSLNTGWLTDKGKKLLT